jgi:hypothetical protein
VLLLVSSNQAGSCFNIAENAIFLNLIVSSSPHMPNI